MLLAASPDLALLAAAHDLLRSGPASVRHPLGFLCVPMHRGRRFGLCLHVWSDDLVFDAPTTSPVHAHSWGLTSYVLTGTLRNDLIDVVPDATAPTHRVFTIRPGSAGDRLRRTSRLVRQRTVASEHIGAGQFYGLAAGLFHATIALGATATLVMAENHEENQELSLGDVAAPSHNVIRLPGGQDELCIAAKVLGLDR
jgi:hypothetical protein